MEGTKLVQGDLSYTIRGILYETHTELGQYWGEKQYCDLIAKKLKDSNLHFIREYTIPASFDGERVGRSRTDFLVEDKVIIEVKVVPSFTPETYKQCLRYLVASGKDLVLLVNFYYKSASIKRIVHPRYLKN